MPGPQPKPVMEKFYAKVQKTESCWPWIGSVDRGTGYGAMRVKCADGRWRKKWAHRLSYELHIGPIEDGREIDHLCRVRSCVNPSHLEMVTAQENIRRGESSAAKAARRDTCAHGHAYTAENTKLSRDGARQCRTCQREWQAKNRERVNESQRRRRAARRVQTIEEPTACGSSDVRTEQETATTAVSFAQKR